MTFQSLMRIRSSSSFRLSSDTLRSTLKRISSGTSVGAGFLAARFLITVADGAIGSPIFFYWCSSENLTFVDAGLKSCDFELEASPLPIILETFCRVVGRTAVAAESSNGRFRMGEGELCNGLAPVVGPWNCGCISWAVFGDELRIMFFRFMLCVSVGTSM